MALGPARRTTCAVGLLLLASACSGEAAAPAPAVPSSPPAVVIPAPEPVAAPTADATGTSEPVGSGAAGVAPIPTAEATASAGVAAGPPAPLWMIPAGRWRPAVDGYVPAVKVGNTTSLDAAAQPFATYLTAMHNRLHPVFAGQFLATLDKLPKTNPLNQATGTTLEIVLRKETGKIVRMGVLKTSGVTAFDVAALDAFHRASPFGKAPDAIASPDGNVYLSWELRRDPIDACTTRNARPYILKSTP